MDVTAWLLRHTPPRPLLVSAPGGTAARLAAERAVRERGWQSAANPAEANLLVVVGVSGAAFEPYLQRVWDSMPAPRARADITDPGETERLLDSALSELRDLTRQRVPEHPAHDHDHGDDHGDDHTHHSGDSDHGGHDTHMNHGGHDHHMGGMGMPGGIPMAGRAADRDGLKLDQLHVPLGPALPLWPAGLIIHTRLQGDVIQEATVELLDSGRDSFWSQGSEPHRQVARRLDASARLLALAGWTDASVVAQRLRDSALAGAPPAAPLRKWAQRVRRSRTLHWLLAGVGSTPDTPATPTQLTGDALTRLHRWLTTALAGEDGPSPSPEETQWTVDNLPSLLTGTELASARLTVASLDPDLDLRTHPKAHHG